MSHVSGPWVVTVCDRCHAEHREPGDTLEPGVLPYGWAHDYEHSETLCPRCQEPSR